MSGALAAPLGWAADRVGGVGGMGPVPVAAAAGAAAGALGLRPQKVALGPTVGVAVGLGLARLRRAGRPLAEPGRRALMRAPHRLDRSEPAQPVGVFLRWQFSGQRPVGGHVYRPPALVGAVPRRCSARRSRRGLTGKADVAKPACARRYPVPCEADCRVEDITAEAATAKGNFYRYFPTWDDLLLAVREQVLDRYREEVRARYAGRSDVDWRAALDEQNRPVSRRSCGLSRYSRTCTSSPGAAGPSPARSACDGRRSPVPSGGGVPSRATMQGERRPEGLGDGRPGLRRGRRAMRQRGRSAAIGRSAADVDEPGEGQDREHTGGDRDQGGRAERAPRDAPPSPCRAACDDGPAASPGTSRRAQASRGRPAMRSRKKARPLELLGELRIGEEGRLDRLLLLGAELAIQVGTQDRIVVEGHGDGLRERGPRPGLASRLPGSRGRSRPAG